MVFQFFKSSAITLFIALLFLCFSNVTSSKAQIVKPSIKKVADSVSDQPELIRPVSGKLHIIAVMVEFEQDENRFTTGNGLFTNTGMPYLNDPSIRIDPLPHNQQYFEAHLEFAKNYYETVSDGKLEIDYTVVPEVVKLSGKMERYSPTGRELNFLPVAEMATETWEIINRQNLITTVPKTGLETAFVIFHAGAGRDIELLGTTLNKTPQDIPSVYLSKNAFREIFDDPSFEGFPIHSADSQVSNTLVLPRTLSRPGEDITGTPFVLQLSLNGLVTAQIGSHIGLPDLFDTESGQSGIGRFGLMDGAGIFSYNGLFPPEMSAWEKAFLGWAEPVTIPKDNESTVNLPAVSLREDQSIVKIELSESEYFLLENRHRDPADNGVTIEIQRPDGSTVSQTFTNSDREFTFQQQGFEELLEPGVVISASNYDFSLPGGLYEENDDNGTLRELNGGILIWHIDENIISEKISSNTINTGSGPGGVTLMEADGSLDIGNPISNGLFNNESNGWAFDFWWSGNDASVITQSGTIQLYQNRFGPDTSPDNSSNSGASADFELLSFSENLPVSSFTLRSLNPFSSLYSEINTSELRELGLSPYTAENRYWKGYPLSVQPIERNGELHFILPGSDGVEILNPDNLTLLDSGIQASFSLQQPLWIDNAQQILLAEIPENRSRIRVDSYIAGEEFFESLWETETLANKGFISQTIPGFADLDHTGEQIRITDGATVQNQNAVQQSEQVGGISSMIDQNQLIIQYPEGEKTHLIPHLSESFRKHTGIVKQSNEEFYVYLLLDNRMLLFKQSESFENKIVINDESEMGWPAFGDVDMDGFTDVLYVNSSDNTIEAKSINGASLPFYPLPAADQSTFAGTPLLSDLNGDGTLEIINQVISNFSLSILAFDAKANPVEGFPLLVGGGATGNRESVHPAISGEYVIALSPDNELKLWRFPNNGYIAWGSRYGNGENNKVSAFITVDQSAWTMNKLIVQEETYNWPNPAKDYTTLRFLTTEAADINIDIISASGKKVLSKTAVTNGAVAEEITLDTSQWASGAYFARVKAKGTRQTEETTIRIAIAK